MISPNSPIFWLGNDINQGMGQLILWMVAKSGYHQLIDGLSHDFVGVLTILLVVQDFAGPSTGHLALYLACGEKNHFSGRCPYRLITNDYRVSYY